MSPVCSVTYVPGPDRGAQPPSESSEICAAVGVDQLARDEDRVLGGEEDGHPRDLVGLGHAAERDLPRAGRDLLLGIAVARLLRVGQAGGDGVDADRGGRDVDDRARLARRDHRARHRLGAEEAALEVHAEHVIPLRLGQLEELGAREDARVVDEDVGGAQLRGRRREDGGDVLAPRDVARDDHRLAAKAPDLGGHALRRLAVVQEVDTDVGAVASQRDGDGPTDALLRARDERNPAAESHGRDEERRRATRGLARRRRRRRAGRGVGDPHPLPGLGHTVAVEHVLAVRVHHFTLHRRRRGRRVGGRRLLVDHRGRRGIVVVRTVAVVVRVAIAVIRSADRRAQGQAPKEETGAPESEVTAAPMTEPTAGRGIARRERDREQHREHQTPGHQPLHTRPPELHRAGPSSYTLSGRSRLIPSRAMTHPVFPLRAVTALFLERQHLTRPRAHRLTPARLTRFVEDVGGLQMDSINVLDRAHYLTVWSRFGPYDRARLDRLVYRRRLFLEYWAHAACLVPASMLPWWKRAMLDYRRRHTGWSNWLRRNTKLLALMTEAIRANGPMGHAEMKARRPRSGSSGWWNWRPVQHAIHYLWMTGVLTVHSRRHFQKRYDLLERAVAANPAAEAVSSEQFLSWH